MGSIPITRSMPSTSELAHVAQMVEHTLGKGEVIGSIPIMGSNLPEPIFHMEIRFGLNIPILNT